MQSVEAFKRRFADQPTAALDELLSAQTVSQMVFEEVGNYRDRMYPPLTTLGLFIEQALSADGACQDAVARNLSERTARGMAECSLSSGPYCKARKRLPLTLIQRLAVAAGDRLEELSCKHWKWRGRTVKLLDGTTISMPDTPANQSAYPQSGEQQPGLGFPLAMLVALNLAVHGCRAALGHWPLPRSCPICHRATSFWWIAITAPTSPWRC